MRVLGVDLGMKRTGIAVSDALGITVRGVETLSPKSRAEDIDRICYLVVDLEVEHVVIGLPTLPQSGDDTPWTKRVRGFAAALGTELETRATTTHGDPIPVHLLDEARTSIEGARRLVEAGVKKSKRKAELDAAAAAVLVEDFIAQMRCRAESAAASSADESNADESNADESNAAD